ncbi:methylenetetrahydrofolate reductase [Tianweitania sediminis]|uniref:Methylenetetrahydrofolate reductase n=1 Tax=Tianweitania sediminis TaxID=1502156 RepID=A0A8J7UIZ6_9HYPH|nr:methylenetetrahydrofolate reductase [Tianweitania sediminis]MBP0440764.1 methylenetetrahydrofolate reductase [Tianweitania sediminis]
MSRLPASIEVAPKQAIESADLPGLLPAGTRVYITDIGTDPADVLTAAARRVHDLGYKPVPHFASRRLTTRAALEDRVKRATSEAGVTDVLVIGGGLDAPAGEFTSTMDVLNTGVFERHGITAMGVAGHPEGSPDFSEHTAIEALREKQAFARRSGIDVRIVTQFGFDADRFADWAEGLKNNGIDLPVHIGVAGPAKIPTLIKYAAMCGVGNSIQFLKKNAMSLTALAVGHSPEEIVSPLERRAARPQSPISHIHVFPFGGLKKSAEWLAERGSLDIKTSAYASA